MPNHLLPEIDPERLRAAWGAIAGATVYGVFTLATLFLSGRPVTTADLLRAAINVLAAMIAGVLCAYVIAPTIAAAIPWQSLRDVTSIGFAIGAVGWEVMPLILQGVKARARREAERQGGR